MRLEDFADDVCLSCGGEFPPTQLVHLRIFCSQRCQYRHRNELQKIARLERKQAMDRRCAWCSDPIAPAVKEFAKFCSDRCAHANAENRRKVRDEKRKSALGRACERCDGPIPPTKKMGSRFCSRACLQISVADRGKDERLASKAAGRRCGFCAAGIATSKNRNAKFCSKSCSLSSFKAKRRSVITALSVLFDASASRFRCEEVSP